MLIEIIATAVLIVYGLASIFYLVVAFLYSSFANDNKYKIKDFVLPLFMHFVDSSTLTLFGKIVLLTIDLIYIPLMLIGFIGLSFIYLFSMLIFKKNS